MTKYFSKNSNHKDIGALYFLFGTISGVIGTKLSVSFWMITREIIRQNSQILAQLQVSSQKNFLRKPNAQKTNNTL